ncbi:MAG: type II toxin-antitoxin system VapC family toxin [Opitutus sp.]
MGFLVDTNVLSELRKRQRCDPHVAEWLAGVAPDELFVSVLSIGEIRRGIELLRQRDPASARALDKWLAGLEAHYSDRILPISPAITDRWGRLSPEQPLPVIDGLLAATGIEHKLTVVTRNTDDFLRSGVNTLNPFLPRSPG